MWLPRGVGVFIALILALVPAVWARRPALTDSDLVLVRGSCGSRLDLAHATARAGRKDNNLRTVYVVEEPKLAEQLQRHFGASHNETYLSWPDRPDPRKPGDSRVAMVPWLAHRALGNTYKWFLYGDDDTFFFLDNVKELLRDYDHNLPYVVTDVLWHKKKRYYSEAPRCLPCHTNPAFLAYATDRVDEKYHDHVARGEVIPDWKAPPVPPLGCPCTPELACEFTLNVTGKRKFLNYTNAIKWSPESKYWGYPDGYPSKCDYPHFHGGSGVLVSLGAMKKVSYEKAVKCYYDDLEKLTAEPGSLKADAHGDRMTSLCFWLHGVALTDPGTSLTRAELSNGGGRVMDARTANVKSLEEAIAGRLSNYWLWSLVNMVAVHVGHKGTPVEVTWQYAELFPKARKAAIKQLTEAGEWGRGEVDFINGRYTPEKWEAPTDKRSLLHDGGAEEEQEDAERRRSSRRRRRGRRRRGLLDSGAGEVVGGTEVVMEEGAWAGERGEEGRASHGGPGAHGQGAVDRA